jgi:hypothetical protein
MFAIVLTLPRRVVPGPCSCAPCPVPRRVEVLSMPLFPTRRSWPLPTPVLPQRSTSARDVMRSGVARPGVGFSGCTSRSLPSSDVASVCCKCFRCFICMWQVFHVDVAKVDRDVAYVVMTIYVCYKRPFQMFRLFQIDVVRVLSGCCICFALMLQVFYPDVVYVFTHMLQMFHLNVAYVLQWLHTCFPCVSDVCCKCFNYFRGMLQVFSTISDVCCKCFL